MRHALSRCSEDFRQHITPTMSYPTEQELVTDPFARVAAHRIIGGPREGLLEVELLPDAKVFPHGRWEYTFRHSVTGKTAKLDTHGFTVDEMRAFTFSPRTYWNGSSTSFPAISDFKTDEFNYRIEFYRKTK
jgi:hypothetical protein